MYEVVWIDKEAVIKSKFINKPLFIATPDTGLISLIAAAHIIQVLNPRLIGYIDAEWTPPISVVKEGEPFMPIRVYTTDYTDILISESPILPSAWRLFAQSTYDVATQLSSSLIIGATGIPNPKRLDIQNYNNLRVFYLGKFLDTEGIDQRLKDYFASVNKFSGTLAGPYSSIITWFLKYNIPFIILLIDSFPEYPDPESAARLIIELNNILNTNIDINSLLERGSEIKLMARQLAMQTRRQQVLAGHKTGSPPVGLYG